MTKTINHLNNRSKNFVFENKLIEQRKEDKKLASQIISLTQAALVMVGDIAAITVGSFWPHPYYHTFCEHRKKSFKSTISRIKSKGLIKKGGEGGKFFILTERGSKERNKILFKISMENSKLNEKWDGKWRVLIFDIPEKYKKYREFLRAELVDYGFTQFQKSVWASPYKIAEKLRASIEEKGMDRWVKLMVADTIFDDKELKRQCGLKS